MGLFHSFLDDEEVAMYGVEAGGSGAGPGQNAVRLGGRGVRGIVQGYKSYFLEDDAGQVMPTHSVSAGLDYAGVGPELAFLRDSKRIAFESATDEEALEAFRILSGEEGIVPALESAHAVAYAIRLAPRLPAERSTIVNISGRGDKDLFITARLLDRERWLEFLSREASDDQSNR